MAPVRGKVLCNGTPITNGSVIFQPKGAKAASGTLDEKGEFTLTTDRNGDGAKIGVHTVTISIDPYKTKVSCDFAAREFEVKAGSNEITIDLSRPKK